MAMNLSLEERHALVCGASSGIGRAIALALASRGASVTVLARRQSVLRELCAELLKAGAPAAHVLEADLDQRAAALVQVKAHIESVGRIHILVNNTGGPPGGPILDAKPEEFEAAIGRHLLAAHMLTQAVLPGMREAAYGRIINIISTSVREPVGNLGVSNTARGAVAAWSKTVSKELPPGITINNILPGFTETERFTSLRNAEAERTSKTPQEVMETWLANVPEGRLAHPEELGAAAAFLASESAGYIRGVSLAIDGGRMAGI